MSIRHLVTVTVLLDLVGTWVVRMSICLFILQLLPFTEKVFRW